MIYYVKIAIRYLWKMRGRTIYSILGILLTFLLNFMILVTGFSVWKYFYLLGGGDDSHAYVNELWTDENRRVVGISREQIEQVKTLASCEEVRSITIYEDNYQEEAGKAKKKLSPQDLEDGRCYFISVGLTDPSDLKQSADVLTQKTGLSIRATETALTYFRQDDGASYLFYHALLSIFVYFFSFFSVMLLRNTMNIAVVERMRDYGLWRCVGMSKKQLRVQLLTEGFFMSLAAAIGGSLAGYALTGIFARWINDLMELQIPFAFSCYFKSTFDTVLLCIAVTLFSLLEPARQAGLLTPIEAIHNNITLRSRKGKLLEDLQYRQSGLWTKLFGVSGEYAYKNRKRNRGRSLGLFFSLAFCVIMIGVSQGGTESLYATIRNAYQGCYAEYLETISGNRGDLDISRKELEQIREELDAIGSVQKTMLMKEWLENVSYDAKLSKYMRIDNAISLCAHYTYDREHMERLKGYLLDGKTDYDEMVQNNGILICDMQYNYTGADTNFNQTDIRRTDYRVGDKITAISVRGKQEAARIYGTALREVAEREGLPVDLEEAQAQKQDGEELVTPLAWRTESDPDYPRYREEMLEIFEREGFSVSAEEITDYIRDPETGKQTGRESVFLLQEIIEKKLYDRGERTEYLIMGILSEDPILGGYYKGTYAHTLLMIHPIDIAEVWEGSRWHWNLKVKRNPLDVANGELEEFCSDREGIALQTSYYSGQNFDLAGYLSILKNLRIARMIGIVIASFVAAVCLIQIFNLICANILLRNKELKLYEMVGMSKKQQSAMLLLEQGVGCFLAVFLGYFAAWGISWYFIEFLLNQDGKIQFLWPAHILIPVSIGIFFLAEFVSFLGIQSTRKTVRECF